MVVERLSVATQKPGQAGGGEGVLARGQRDLSSPVTRRPNLGHACVHGCARLPGSPLFARGQQPDR